MDRKEFIKLGFLSGVSAVLLKHFSPELRPDNYSFLIISDTPLTDQKKLNSILGSSSEVVINLQPVRPVRQDLTILKDNLIIDPVNGNDIDKRITEFAIELRQRKQPGNTLISAAFPPEEANTVTFEVNNCIAEKIQLFRNYDSIVIPGFIGNTEFRLHNGRLSVITAPCRHKLCQMMDAENRGRIVCVPNKVIASINISREAAVDAITG